MYNGYFRDYFNKCLIEVAVGVGLDSHDSTKKNRIKSKSKIVFFFVSRWEN